MNAKEELENRGITKCPECRCAIGDDWEYVDFSNKSIIECPQCKNKIFEDDVDLMKEKIKYDAQIDFRDDE